MIGYVTLGTNDLEKAVPFYEALLSELGAQRFMENDRMVVWAVSPKQPAISVNKPFDGEPATIGNGTMIALAVDSTEKVDSLHAKALGLGAADEGQPGVRGGGFYAAYFRDLDGNKLNVFCTTKMEG